MMDSSLPPCPPGLTVDSWTDVVEDVQAAIRVGFTTCDSAIEMASDFLADEELAEDAVWATATELVAALWERQLARQALWTNEGDSAKLDSAFARLEHEGIVARMNFTCCQTCGRAEIDDERDDSREWKGYVYFHSQDADRLDDGSLLYLSYGAFIPTSLQSTLDHDKAGQWHEDHMIEVARQAVTILRNEGLDVQWDGDANQRIRVAIATWRRKLPTT